MTQYSVEQVSEAFGRLTDQLDELEHSYLGQKADITARLAKIKQWLWKNGEHTADSIVEEFIALRDKRAAVMKAAEDEERAIKAEMELREAWLLEAMKGIGAESFRTSHGTAYKQLKVRSNCNDWPGYWAWMAATGRFDGVEKRVGQKMISDMLEAGEDLPPGISTHSEQVVTIRKS